MHLCSVTRSKVVTGLCLTKPTGKWNKEKVLLCVNDHDEGTHVGYVLTPIRLKQTICGEIIKGIKLMKVDANRCNVEHGECLAHESKQTFWVMTRESVAIKINRRHSMQLLHNISSTVTNPENPWKEVAALQLIGNTHPNVIHLLGAFVDDECLYEVMPYCSGGSLKAFMRHHPNGISETQSRDLFVQIILGLHHIHAHGVCHHDISTDNCLLDETCTKLVIIDFGMSLRVPYSYIDDPSGITDDVTDESMRTTRRLIHSHAHCGKLAFMAPEIYLKEYAIDGLTADIWSAGIVLFFMITGRHPYVRPDIEKDTGFYDLVDESFYWNNDNRTRLISWGCEVSNALVDFMKTILRVEPRERATLYQILKHDWLGVRNVNV